jgi:RNA polymerase sigma-70 factor (ECF subfamily)
MAHEWQPDFEQLVEEHQSMVFSLALRMTGDRGLAEEIAQDVFLELDRNLGKIKTPEHALFWLRRVAMSRSSDALRRRRVRGMDLWVEINEARTSAADEPSSSPLGARMEYLLTTLPPAQRAAIVLRYQEDMPPEEIAATLDAPVATVKSHLQRGLKLLRAKATNHLREYIRGA